ncbi:hypothetical protein [Sphingomonas nostoxanthinifaciens]|uniref:hypothetical protein n=1 Tax=Sphingomonas nostoxanthinifaciens TaxID=2872652 RepID=UPI001CC201BB|nr:hypothetical protein [Sphingomonas nostoxanthinifaciens]UAK24177.1 hypothetical protein K8P63_17900 [Sphingomonas nostoxanthinifaciens]
MSDDPKERWRAVIDSQMSAATADAADRVKNQLALAQEALKALLIANGGAMVALFTFVGNVLSRAPTVRFDFHNLRVAFCLFVIGFTVDLIAYVLAFMSQDRFYNTSMAELERLRSAALIDQPILDQAKEFKLIGQGFGYYFCGLGLALVSVISFALGSVFALAGVLV